MNMTHPKKHSGRYLFGFPQNGQNSERIEHLLPEPKKCSLAFRSKLVPKKTSSERSERSGEFKRVKERGEVFDSREGFGRDQGSKVTKLKLGAVW